jgi:multidrug efflux system membrane fusion protein
MTRKTVVLVALPTVVLAAAAALYFALAPGFEKAATASVAPSPVPVVAGVVKSHDVPLYLRGVGTVIAYNTDVVRSQITGELTQITFTEGQTVKAGDLLAQIDPRPYQAQLDQMGLLWARMLMAAAKRADALADLLWPFATNESLLRSSDWA